MLIQTMYQLSYLIYMPQRPTETAPNLDRRRVGSLNHERCIIFVLHIVLQYTDQSS